MTKDNHIVIRQHTKKKYNIISEYIGACEKFDRKYRNVAYIDTHGGSGKVRDFTNGKLLINGSPLLASQIGLCHIIEIDKRRCELLRHYTSGYDNIIIHEGDCNLMIRYVLNQIPKNKFIPCLVDPDALTYKENDEIKLQLTAQTLDAIAQHPRTEILLNLLVFEFFRIRPHIEIGTIPDYITPLFGSYKWNQIENNPDDWCNLFISERFKKYYKYIIATPTKNSKEAILYYLIFATNNEIGHKIMNEVFHKYENFTVKDNGKKKKYKTLSEWL